MRIDTGNSTGEFLSTLSLRRATSSKIISSSIIAYFYPRSPCGERRPKLTPQSQTKTFLSTLSLRRATQRRCVSRGALEISIHALLAESDIQDARTCLNILISIHALLAESDLLHGRSGHNVNRISIHALLAESDSIHTARKGSDKNFYPRSPCGERLRKVPLLGIK